MHQSHVAIAVSTTTTKTINVAIVSFSLPLYAFIVILRFGSVFLLYLLTLIKYHSYAPSSSFHYFSFHKKTIPCYTDTRNERRKRRKFIIINAFTVAFSFIPCLFNVTEIDRIIIRRKDQSKKVIFLRSRACSNHSIIIVMVIST